jgi:Raf kinase inhibitor-like YbhB/YbcL family protein
MPDDRDQQTPPGSDVGAIDVSSEAFEHGDGLPARFAHDRDNVSPPLSWSGAPRNAAELELLCEDPDAPGGTFTHWFVTGIDPSTTGVAEGSVPAGAVVGRNDFGEEGWGGPEPPKGDAAHRYVFTVVASSARLALGAGVAGDDVRAALQGNELARGQLVGLYQRS